MKISIPCLLGVVQATAANAQLSNVPNVPKRLRSLSNQQAVGLEFDEDQSVSMPMMSTDTSFAMYPMGGGLSAKANKLGGKSSKGSCPLKQIPINEDDFGEPDWETILELAFPPWETPANGCPRLDAVGGERLPEFGPATDSEDRKFNPCYYTKGFAGLDPARGGYPTPIDTHYPYEFAAPFKKQPGDGSVHHCNTDEATIDIGSCPKLGNTCGKDCAVISDDYGIGHIPPFGKLHDVDRYWYGKRILDSK